MRLVVMDSRSELRSVVSEARSREVDPESIHRFLLGRQRTDPFDRLVDFVIAWEAILLTQNGDPMKGELSYRFSVNGATVLNASSRQSTKDATSMTVSDSKLRDHGHTMRAFAHPSRFGYAHSQVDGASPKCSCEFGRVNRGQDQPIMEKAKRSAWPWEE